MIMTSMSQSSRSTTTRSTRQASLHSIDRSSTCRSTHRSTCRSTGRCTTCHCGTRRSTCRSTEARPRWSRRSATQDQPSPSPPQPGSWSRGAREHQGRCRCGWPRCCAAAALGGQDRGHQRQCGGGAADSARGGRTGLRAGVGGAHGLRGRALPARVRPPDSCRRSRGSELAGRGHLAQGGPLKVWRGEMARLVSSVATPTRATPTGRPSGRSLGVRDDR